MPEYKTVRLELQVYTELQQRMRPMESMSQALQRLLEELDEVYGHARAIIEVKGGQTGWNMKK